MMARRKKLGRGEAVPNQGLERPHIQRGTAGPAQADDDQAAACGMGELASWRVRTSWQVGGCGEDLSQNGILGRE